MYPFFLVESLNNMIIMCI